MITTRDQLANTKIRVNSPEESKRIQHRAFELGFQWGISGKTVSNSDASYLFFFDDGEIAFLINDEHYFINNHKREITLADLFG